MIKNVNLVFCIGRVRGEQRGERGEALVEAGATTTGVGVVVVASLLRGGVVGGYGMVGGGGRGGGGRAWC